MNLYFLVEGRRTEKKVYPKWLSVLLPQINEVKFPHEITQNNFYIFSGNGYPSILDNHLVNSIDEVNSIGNFDFLVMCIDAEEVEVEERKKEVYEFISQKNLSLSGASKFVLIIQNRCIETWCLGNKRIFKNNPNSETLRSYIEYYNVKQNDPELMGNIENFETHAQFHGSYLSEMLRERNIRYTKKNPSGVVEKHYLDELIKRATTTTHIQTFKTFLDFCSQVSKDIK